MLNSKDLKLRNPLARQAEIADIEKAIYSKILYSGRKNKKLIPQKVHIRRNDKIIATMICTVILILAFATIYYYNIFINLEYNIEANLAQIDTQIQKRKNLIINLGITVLEYSKHEREIFSYLAELRAANGAGNYEKKYQDFMASQNAEIQDPDLNPMDSGLANWEKTLSQLMAVAEEYPDLELSENFRKYMDAILEFENKIAELRMAYNTSVNQYSTLKDQFPGVAFAAVLGFEDFKYFRLDIDEKGFMRVK